MRIKTFALASLLLTMSAGVFVVPALLAQDALTGIKPGTQVRNVTFEFDGDHLLDETELRLQVATVGQGGFVWFRKRLGFLPLVPPLEPRPFDPLQLQGDVIRLRQYYREAGFLRAEVQYDVRYEAKSDLVWVVFKVREGPPVQIVALEFTGVDSVLPTELQRPWTRHVEKERSRVGRFSEQARFMIADSAARWFRDRGYPFASAVVAAAVDSAANEARVTVEVRSGVRARIASIGVEGNTTVPARHLTRQLAVKPGDWYSAYDLEQSRLQLTQLDIVRLALFQPPQRAAAEDGVDLQLKVTENPPRLISGALGFASDGGLTGEAEWTHRSFLGGVRTFSVAAVAQTGLLALEEPQRLYRLGPRLFHPYVGNRRLSAAAGPFIEYRDDIRDRSWAFGLEGSLVLAESPLRSVSLGYALSRRRVLEYGIGADLGPAEYLALLGLSSPGDVDILSPTIRRSTVSLQGSYGFFDEFTYPRKGYVVRPRIEVTVPGGLNSTEYLLLDLGASAFIPLKSNIGFALRGSVGRIYPYGKSVVLTGNESPIVSLLRLGDVPFTAGGSRDVRGWGTQLIGPKLPEVEQETVDGGIRTFADRYTALGGLARITTSAELRVPIPGLGDKWHGLTFVDGGRIWTPDDRFAIDAGELDQDDFYTAAGVGINYVTIVGAVQVAVGYKLNPSVLDLRSPSEVFQALANGQPASSAPADSRRRFQLHFALGTTF